MRGEHDPTHDRRPGTARRGRRPYDDPVSPASAPSPPPAPPPILAYGTAEDPFSYGSWVSLDVTPIRVQARRRAPAPPQWSWRELPRDRFLRPALIFGFLAAAGVGVWTSGWVPAHGPAGVRAAAPAPPSPTGDHHAAATPRAGTRTADPVLAAAPAPTSPAKPAHGLAQGSPPAERPRIHRASGGKEGREREAGKGQDRRGRERHGPARAQDEPRAASATPDGPNGSPGQDRAAGVVTAGGADRPARTGRSSRTDRTARAVRTGRRGRPGAPGTRPSASRGEGGARRGAGSDGGGREGDGVPGSASTGSGTGGAQGNTASPAAPRETDTGSGGPSNATGTGSSGTAGSSSSNLLGDRLSASYACRHLRPDDWRYGYCVTAWNEYKRRVGLP
ncbi:hypothetical protein AB0395_41440 [Streptosporangium sp. NPDC051023]|uniref:hypothetical protein n=1 Tax=Streptosporangium sp. NPDC051023 TaxID=3155410 RepID=UPI00344FF121